MNNNAFATVHDNEHEGEHPATPLVDNSKHLDSTAAPTTQCRRTGAIRNEAQQQTESIGSENNRRQKTIDTDNEPTHISCCGVVLSAKLVFQFRRCFSSC